MKCSYCGRRANDSTRPVTLFDDRVLDLVCSECKGQYLTLRLQTLIKKGRTLQEARVYLVKLSRNLWTDTARQPSK